MKCIYCLENKSGDCFKKTEHVLPQSFGTFKNNLTLNIKNDPKLSEVVCDDCNDFFGKNIENSLARDSIEGMVRFENKVRKPHQFKSPGKKSRLKIKVAEGHLKGAIAYREYSELAHEIIIKPAPQVGFKKRTGDISCEFFPLDKIPDKEHLEKFFDLKAKNSIVVRATNLEHTKKRLAEKGITFNSDGETSPSKENFAMECEVTGQVDQTIFRAVAKIALNYLAYWGGQIL